MNRCRTLLGSLVVGLVFTGGPPAGAAMAATGWLSEGPAQVVPLQADVSEAVTLPVEDVAGAVEDLVFAEASADGAVTDRDRRSFTLASDVLFSFGKASLTA